MNAENERDDHISFPYSPIETAIALSLYAYNVSPEERARVIYSHFGGDCMEMEDLISLFNRREAYAVTELPMPSAIVYVNHALERYGVQAGARVRAERSACQ